MQEAYKNYQVKILKENALNVLLKILSMKKERSSVRNVGLSSLTKMTLKTVRNPFLVDLFPPFRNHHLAPIGTIAEVIAIILTITIMFGYLSFRDPILSITIALWLVAFYSHFF